jgi:putative transport protein
MNWIFDLFLKQSVSQTVVVLGCIAILGLLLGSIKVKGIGLGIAGVLFAGIAFGHFGFKLNDSVFEFVQEFGLLLFVYTVGLQVGPGFLASLRKQGLWLNILTLLTVLLGAGIVVLWYVFGKIPLAAVAGMFSGATTNTPSLAAGQTALASIANLAPNTTEISGTAYAIAYPFGVIGIILTMVIVKGIFRVNAQTEAKLPHSKEENRPSSLVLEVTNGNFDGASLKEIPYLVETGLIVSRVLRGDRVFVPDDETRLAVGDVVNVVGPIRELRQFTQIIGQESKVDIKAVPSALTMERVSVTHRKVLGKTIGELGFESEYGAVIARVTRGEVELTAKDDISLQFGDTLFVVGSRDAVQKVADIVGNKAKALNHSHMLTVFIGIVLGAILGAVPIQLPGVPFALRLGLAGGPLLVAIAISLVGRLGPLISYLSPGGNFVLREIGVTLFLAAVGLKSGAHFFSVLFEGPGFLWMLAGATVTFFPLLISALIGRLAFKIRFVDLCGTLAGSMTDPPALVFATSFTSSEEPLVAYATVYPLTVIARVFIAQVLVFVLAGM